MDDDAHRAQATRASPASDDTLRPVPPPSPSPEPAVPVTTVRLPWSPGREVGASVHGEPGGPVLVFAHGAGTDRAHPLVAGTAAGVAAAGITVVTFDYPYRAEGRRWPPDRADVLLESHRAVLDWCREELGSPPVAGGRSMGGRIASMLAARGAPCVALVCHAYPLHPVRRPDRPRSGHLGDVGVPMLFVRGTADAMATAPVFDREVRSLPRAEVADLDGVDHSFDGPGGRSGAVAAAVEATVRFVRRVRGG